jgi:hypothetical protein
MYEVHGPAYVPAYGKPNSDKIHPWFPKVFLYAVMLFSVYIAILLAVASLFPLVLPPAYSATTAGTITVQPDWYLLWLYQLLKIQIFEGSAAVDVLVAVIIFGVLLFLMPFYDRSKRRNLSQRPVYATIGAILILELITLTIWGYLTPGRILPNYQAVLLLGGVAVVTAIAVLSVYRLRGKIETTKLQTPSTMPIQRTSDSSVESTLPAQRKKSFIKNVRNAGESILNKFTAVFVVFLVVASVSLASAVNMLPKILANAPFFAAALTAFVVSSFFMCHMLRKFVLAYEGAVVKR